MQIEDMTFRELVDHNTKYVADGLAKLATDGSGDPLRSLMFTAMERTSLWSQAQTKKAR